MISIFLLALLANIPDQDNASDSDDRKKQAYTNSVCQLLHLGNAKAHQSDYENFEKRIDGGDEEDDYVIAPYLGVVIHCDKGDAQEKWIPVKR